VKVWLAIAGFLLTVLSGAGGYVYNQLNGDIEDVKADFDQHRQDNFEHQVWSSERLARIEAILETQVKLLEEVRDELRQH